MTQLRAKNKLNNKKIQIPIIMVFLMMFTTASSTGNGVSSVDDSADMPLAALSEPAGKHDSSARSRELVSDVAERSGPIESVMWHHPVARDYILQQLHTRMLEWQASNDRINKDLRDKAKERKKLVKRANKVAKHTVPFHPNATTNAGNRYRSWLAQDRTIKKISSPRAYAAEQVRERGWSWKNWACLDRLWWHESNWRYKAGDKSGQRAYGIPQAAPGKKMAASGKDWQRNPATQIDWGLDYIENRYGNPCKAWSFWANQAAFGDHGWGWY